MQPRPPDNPSGQPPVPPPPYAGPPYPPQGYGSQYVPGPPAPKSNRGVVVALVVCGVVVLVALCGVLGVVGYLRYSKPSSPAKPVDLSAVRDYSHDPDVATRDHFTGHITYRQSPPVGGRHNPRWQTCDGFVYSDRIPDETAVHSLEHGAVWITYRPDLPRDQVDSLARRVRGIDYTLMSPYPGQASPISLQVWGRQLAVDRADDPRIDLFVQRLRGTGPEQGVPCSGGFEGTGTDLPS